MEHFMLFGSMFTLMGVLLIPGLLIIVSQWRIYEKAGQPGWAVLIPFYNFYVLLKIVGKPGWWLIWMFVPLANIVIGIWVINLLSISFGKGVGFTLGLIFLPIIFYPILGFGNVEYKGGAGKPQVTQINI